MEENHDSGRGLAMGLLAGVAIGALIGAAVGLLFAPQPGTKTRESIGSNLSTAVDKIKQMAESVQTNVQSKAEQVRDTMKEEIAKRREQREGTEENPA
jgi:gas vesicle protein